MNTELEQEAEKLRQLQYTDGSISTYTRNDWQSCWKEGFIAGAISKYVEKEKLKFAIEQLKSFDFNMCKLLRQEAINYDLSQEEATYKLERTKWHLEIISKIKELEQQLKQLQ